MLTALNSIRHGKTDQISYFNQFAERQIPEDAVYICGTNAEADRINQDRLEKLDGQFIAYTAEKEGRTSDSQVDEIVLLKENEKVMFTVNDVVRNRYTNGMIGVVKALYNDHATVMINDKDEINVYKHTFTSYSYSIIGETLTKREVGKISQIPLKPAYAITIHKSQGKTFDKAVISPGTFAPGQLYVALSRISSPDGLYLTDYINESSVISDDLAARFSEDYEPIVFEKKTVAKKPAVKKGGTAASKKKQPKTSNTKAVKSKTVKL